MKIEEIYTFIEQAEKFSFDEICIENEGIKIQLKRNQVSEVMMSPMPLKEQVKKDVSTEAVADDNLLEVKAPMVGTFYRAPAPNDKPFVMVGQEVKKGQVVGIIEAMKMMNEIISPADGVVEAIEAEDGALVDFNKSLIKIKKAI